MRAPNTVVGATLLALALATAGCRDRGPCLRTGHVPDSWTLTASGVTVEVTRSPFAYRVRDAAGTEVLRSLGPGADDGYGTVGFTGGSVIWSNVVSGGYFSMTPVLNPWQDDLRVVAASQPDATRLDLSLEQPGARFCSHMTLVLRDSTLRVEASTDGPTPRAFSAAFESPADEAFMGFGERYNRTDQRGLAVYSFPEEGGLAEGEGVPPSADNPFPNGQVMTYYPVPFFVSSRGYGFWLDSTWRNEFDLAADRTDAWRVWHIGPTLAYEVYLPIADDPRPWPLQVVDLFTRATGRPMVPPPWTLGPRRRVGRGSVQNGVPEIQAMRDLDLAITAVDDATHFLPRGVSTDEDSALRAWTASARSLGYRVNCYFNPYLAEDPDAVLYPTYQEGIQKGYFLKNAAGEVSLAFLISGSMVNIATVDVTWPEATAWYTAMFQRALDLGYSGWMLDFGEYVQPDVVAWNGMTGEELHNLFPVLYHRASHDALEAGTNAGDWLTFVRSGYTGSSQYSPLVWGGDPDASFAPAGGLPAQVRAAINIGLSGVPNWGSDIGGFKCVADGSAAADGELWARWIQFGAMTPNMQDQNACTGGAGGSAGKASIWTEPDAMAAWATYARLHTRLFPYFYTLAHEAHATGAPVVRHLFAMHPDRADLAAVDDQFYCGPALLAAPVVTRGQRARDVILPTGLYLDWREQTLHEAGTITADAPLDKLPLFLRDGYLVPLLDPTIDTLDDGDHPGVVGPRDVADVYDVVGLVSTTTGGATFTLWDGGTLGVTWRGGLAAGTLTPAAAAADLATCDGCYLSEDLASGLQRLRLSSSEAAVTAGGLEVQAAVVRRVRWDLYLVE